MSSPRSPPRPRNRIFACDECARRKQRCDKVIPKCTPCQKASTTCTESERERNVVQTEDKGVVRKGYVRVLEDRVRELEIEVARRAQGQPVDAGRERPPNAGGQRVGGRYAPDGTQTGENSESAQWPIQGPNMNMDSLSLSAMAEPRTRAGEFLSELSIPRLIAGMTETYGGNPETTSRLDCLWDSIARDIRHPDNAQSHRLRLDRAEALESLETYLEMVDFRFPKLRVDKVRSGIEAITADDDAVYKSALRNNPMHIFMAYMVVGIVPLVSDRYPVSHGSFVSIHVMAKCLRVLDQVFRKEDGVDVIQCLHLLVVFALHSSAAGSSWHLIGFAMNKCIALGYHRESHAGAEDELQQRRWAFWGCYLLDVLICSALDRPLSIDDDYVTVSLPGELDTSVPLSDAERRHVHLFQYARLMASTLQPSTPGRDFDYHLSRLLHWRTLTPSLPTSTPALERSHAHETSLFNTLMLRCAIKEIVQRPPADVPSAARAIRHMRLSDICQAVMQSLDRHTMIGRPYLSVTTGYSAFSAGLAMVYCNACLADGVDISGMLESALRKLDTVARQFPRMGEYRQLVARLQSRVMAVGRGEATADAQLEGLVDAVGPGHLKGLARATMACLESRVQGQMR